MKRSINRILSSALVIALALTMLAAFPMTALAAAAESANNPATNFAALKDAVVAANANSDADTIWVKGNFAFNEALTISAPLTINGVGNPVLSATGFRHFIIGNDTAPKFNVTLEGLTLAGPGESAATADAENGGIYTGQNNGFHEFTGTLTLKSCVIKDCVNDSPVFNRGFGGGMYMCMPTSSLVMQSCELTGNKTKVTGGGVRAGIATLTNCTVSGNTAGAVGGGVGVYTATLTDCTVSGNTATDNAGGVYATTATLTNCTVSGNTTAKDGGGVFVDDTATLTSCTVTGNKAANDGGGVYARDPVDIRGSIAAGNTANRGHDIVSSYSQWLDVGLTTDGKHNIIGYSGLTEASVFGGAPALANNGGTTQTILIMRGGPAQDKIPEATLRQWERDVGLAAGTLSHDQRGVSRPQGGAGELADIGAVELKGMLLATHLRFAPSSAVYDGTPKSVVVSPAPGVTDVGAVTVYYEGTGGTQYAKSAAPPTDIGTYAITVDVSEGVDYLAAAGLSLGNFQITPAPPSSSGGSGYSQPAIEKAPAPVPTAFPAQGTAQRRLNAYVLDTLKGKVAFRVNKGDGFTLLGIADNGRALLIQQGELKGYIAIKDFMAAFGAQLRGTATAKKAGVYTMQANGKLKRIGYYPLGTLIGINGVDGGYFISKRASVTYWLKSGEWRISAINN